MSVCVRSVGIGAARGAGPRPNDYLLSGSYIRICSIVGEAWKSMPPGSWNVVIMSLSVKFCELMATHLPAGTASELLCSMK